MMTLLLMFLLHIIDDFHLQGCMKEMKQKSWWLRQKGYKDLYENDYKMVLFMHSLSWSIAIMFPILVFMDVPKIIFITLLLGNIVIHGFVDDLKCNKFSINLIEDQAIHILQIVVTWTICQYFQY